MAERMRKHDRCECVAEGREGGQGGGVRGGGDGVGGMGGGG